jgi:two-component system, OmpR family, aerobic respiration control sensor histidine kinase ArcB
MIYRIIKEIEEGISEQFPVNLFLVNKTGKLVWVNENMLKLSGVSNFNEIIGTHVRQFGERFWETTLKVIRSKKRETLYEEKKGKVFFVMKLPFSKGSFKGVLGFSIDITSLKQAEKAKQEFVLNMSHDLRTPFTGVYTCAVLSHADTKEEKTREHLNSIITSSKQWMNVVDNIFTVYKADTIDYKVSSFNIRTLLLEIQALYAAVTYTRGLQFFVTCENCYIETQYLRLKQVLVSLISNAIKFTVQGYIEIMAFATEELLTLQVKDTGIGIPKDKQEYIFEQFTKLKPSGESGLFVGAGLGLYITKQCVKQLKGKIKLSSQLGEGSLFRVEIPLNSDK